MKLSVIRLPNVNLNEKRTLVVLWLILSTYLLFFGGAINPLTAEEQFRRRMKLTALVDPNNTDVGELNDDFEQFLQDSEQVVKTRDKFSSLEEYEVSMIEIFTYLRVKHKPDIMQYLTVDHRPTVREVMQAGSDDGDGRAILAASLLLFRGYDAWVLDGPWHHWVQVFLGSGTPMQILEKKGIGVGIWYLRFNDREVVFNYVQTIGYVLYEWFLASLIVTFLFYSYKHLQAPFIRRMARILLFIVVVTQIICFGALLVVILLYRIIWGV